MWQRALTRTSLAVLALSVVVGCSQDKGGATAERNKQQEEEKPKAAAAGREKPGGRPQAQKTDPYLEALLASPNDRELLDGIYRRIAQQCDGSNARQLEDLTGPQRMVLQVWGTTALVDDGTFRALFASEIGDFAGIDDAFDAIGVPAAADAVRQAVALFPGGRPPADAHMRLAYLAQLRESGDAKLSEYSREFWDAHRQIQRQTAAYVRAHRDAFAGLPAHPQESREEWQGKNLPPPDAEAYSRDVARWLESIGAWILVAAPTVQEEPFWVTANLPDCLRGDARIVGLRLAPYRTSTDAELRTVARLEALREVGQLDLADTYVSEAGLAALRQIGDLRRLSLRNTDLIDAWLPQLQGLAALEELDLTQTQITGTGLADLARLPQLRSLQLYRTRISGEVCKPLSKLPNLERLSLGNTAVDDEGLEGLAALGRLRRLDLQRTGITDEALRHVQELAALEELDLCATHVGDLGMTCLKKLANLKSLQLDNTRVGNEGLSSLGTLVGLRELSLSGTDVGDAGMAQLRGLRRLERLRLSGTAVGDAGLTHVGMLRELVELDLCDSRVTDAGLPQLYPLAKISYISLGTRGVSESGVARLTQALPKAEIQRK